MQIIYLRKSTIKAVLPIKHQFLGLVFFTVYYFSKLLLSLAHHASCTRPRRSGCYWTNCLRLSLHSIVWQYRILVSYPCQNFLGMRSSTLPGCSNQWSQSLWLVQFTNWELDRDHESSHLSSIQHRLVCWKDRKVFRSRKWCFVCISLHKIPHQDKKFYPCRVSCRSKPHQRTCFHLRNLEFPWFMAHLNFDWKIGQQYQTWQRILR